jgi:hypothetical protein
MPIIMLSVTYDEAAAANARVDAVLRKPEGIALLVETINPLFKPL